MWLFISGNIYNSLRDFQTEKEEWTCGLNHKQIEDLKDVMLECWRAASSRFLVMQTIVSGYSNVNTENGYSVDFILSLNKPVPR